MSDPRDESNAHIYVMNPNVPEDFTESYNIFAMLSGMAAMLLKFLPGAWIGLFLTLSSFATKKNKTADGKQVLTSFLFCLFAIFSCYFTARQVRAPSTA